MEIGDKVEWTKVMPKGGGFKMTQQNGTLVDIVAGMGLVKKKNGHIMRISTEKLHVTGSGDNQLTRLMMDLAHAGD